MYTFFYENHCGIVDKTGKIVMQPQFKELYKNGDIFYSDRGFFKNPDKITKLAVHILPFSCGLAAFKFQQPFIAPQQWLWGLMDDNLNVIMDPKFERITEFYDGVAAVNFNGKWGFIDTECNYVIEPSYLDFDTIYTRILFYQRWTQNGIAAVKDERGWHYIDKHGNDLFGKYYDYALAFYNGLALVQVNDKYEYIDEKGNQAIEPIFDRATSFEYGDYAEVYIGEEEVVIDKEGNIYRCEATDSEKNCLADDFFNLLINDSKEYLIEKSNGKYGLKDATGVFVVEPVYDRIEYVWGDQGKMDEDKRPIGIAIAQVENKLWIIDMIDNFKTVPIEDVHPLVELLPDGKTLAYLKFAKGRSG
jgi:hypothetical protein